MFPLKRMCPRWKHAAGNLKFHIARYLAEHEMSLTKLFWMDKNYSEHEWGDTTIIIFCESKSKKSANFTSFLAFKQTKEHIFSRATFKNVK